MTYRNAQLVLHQHCYSEATPNGLFWTFLHPRLRDSKKKNKNKNKKQKNKNKNKTKTNKQTKQTIKQTKN